MATSQQRFVPTICTLLYLAVLCVRGNNSMASDPILLKAWVAPSVAGDAIWGPPCSYNNNDSPDDVLIVASMDSFIYKLDMKTGKVLWRVAGLGPHRGAPVCFTTQRDDGIVIVTTITTTAKTKGTTSSNIAGMVAAYRISDGTRVWSWATNQNGEKPCWVFSPVLSNQDTIVSFGIREGATVSLNTSNGKELSRIRSNAGVWGKPLVISEGRTNRENMIVMAITADATVHAYRKSLLWSYDMYPGVTHWKGRLAGWIFSSPRYLAREGLVVFGSNDGAVRALSVDTGHLVWKRDLAAGRISSDVEVIAVSSLHGVVLVVVTEGGHVFVLDTKSNVLARTAVPMRTKRCLESAGSATIVLNDQQGLVVVAGDSGGSIYTYYVPLTALSSSTTTTLKFTYSPSSSSDDTQCPRGSGVRSVSSHHQHPSVVVVITCDNGAVVALKKRSAALPSTTTPPPQTVVSSITSIITPSAKIPSVSSSPHNDEFEFGPQFGFSVVFAVAFTVWVLWVRRRLVR
eukprot:PhM_4_TR13620/c0_g1_i1/m.63843